MFLLPVFILLFLSYYHFSSIITANFNESNQNALTLIKDQLDTKIFDIINISVELSHKPELKPYYMDTFYGFHNSSERLNYKSANNFFHDIFYYVRNGDYFYSGNGTYRSSLFFKEHLHYENIKQSDFNNLMNEGTHILVRGSEPAIVNNDHKKVLSVIVPIPLNANQPHATALFVVGVDKLQDMFKSILKYPNSNIIVFDDKGRELVSMLDIDQYVTASIIETAISNPEENNQQIKLLGTEYLLSIATSDKTGWTLIAMTPRSYLIGPVKELQQKANFALLVILIVGLLIIYFMMHMNYNPIRNLIYMSDRFASRFNVSKSGLDLISNTLQHMDATSELLITQASENRNAVIQHSFFQLIIKYGEDCDASLRKLREIGYSLNHPPYYIAMVEFNFFTETVDMEKTVEQLENGLSALKEIYRIEMPDTHKLVWIVSASDNNELEHNVIWDYALQIVRESHDFDITIGFGNATEDLTKLSKSYIEAHTALQYKIIHGSNCCIAFCDINKEDPHIEWKPFHIIDTLKLLLQEQQSDKLKVLADSIAEKIQKESGNLFVAKCWVIETIHVVLLEMKTLDAQYAMNYPDVLALSDYHRLEDLSKIAKKTILHAAEYFSHLTSPDDNKINIYLDYLQENMFDPQFSVQEMANHFSCSRQHINSFFKEHTQITIIEHVNQHRITKSKHMLVSSKVVVP